MKNTYSAQTAGWGPNFGFNGAMFALLCEGNKPPSINWPGTNIPLDMCSMLISHALQNNVLECVGYRNTKHRINNEVGIQENMFKSWNARRGTLSLLSNVLIQSMRSHKNIKMKSNVRNRNSMLWVLLNYDNISLYRRINTPPASFVNAWAKWDLQMGDYFGNDQRCYEIEKLLIDDNYQYMLTKCAFPLWQNKCSIQLWMVYVEQCLCILGNDSGW